MTLAKCHSLYQTPPAGKTLGNALDSLADYPEHPPLYDILTRYWMMIFQQPVSARVLAVLLSFIYLPCAYWLCLELFRSQWAGWIAMGLLSVSPYHTQLARGAREYSLWTILLLVSSSLLLRAFRRGRISDWILYGVSVAVGMYSHLFFGFLVIAHGIYALLFEWRRLRSRLLPFILASGAGIVAFGPWLMVVLFGLDTIEENTQWVRGRNTTFVGLVRSSIANLGNAFVDLDSQFSWESYADLLIVALVVLAVYCYIRWNSIRIWMFALLPVLVTGLGLAVPDLLGGGARAGQSRYLVPAILGIELVVAYFLANGMQRSKHRWERFAWSSVFGLLMALGVASNVVITQNPGWDYLQQGRTASVVNLEIGPIINQSDNPLVLSEATHSFLLALSYEVEDTVTFQLLQSVEPDQWKSLINLQAFDNYSDVFVYFPSREFLSFWEETYGITPEPVFEKSLYRIAAS